jgi:hypothetical protein
MIELSIDRIFPQRAKALKEVLAAKPDLKSDVALSDFVSAYLLCEALANKLIEYLETDDPPRKAASKKIKCSNCGAENECSVRNKSNNRFKTLDVRNIRKAVTHFSLGISIDDVDAVFTSGNGKAGQRTPRQLRNEYAHSLSSGSQKEIAQRSSELLGLMMRFCTSVENLISEPNA